MRYWLLFSLIFSLSAFGCEESDSGSGTGLIGESCGGPSDCASGPCVDTGSGTLICTQTCDDASPCPSGYSCAAAESSSVCVPDMSTAGGSDMPTGGMDVPVGGMDMPVGGMDMPVGGTEMPVDNDCGEIVTCANSCMDQSCVQSCFQNGTSEGQGRFNDLLACLQNTIQTGQCGQEDFACQNQACGTELTACVGEQGPMMTGTLSCSDLNACFSMCNPNDQACVQDCFNNATATAQQQYGAIITCAQNSGCPEADNACVNNACSSEIQACLGGGSTPAVGSLSCGGVFLCASSCGQNDSACQNNCIQAVAADQAELLDAYLGCAETNMCQDQACIETNCAAEEAACFPPGDQSCGQVLDCIGMCQDQSCAGECQLQATEEASTELQALGECLNTNSCMSFDCPQCATEYANCAN